MSLAGTTPQAPGVADRLSCRVVSDLDGLTALRPAWAELLAASEANEPTLSPLWLTTWWQVFGPHEGRTLHCLVFEDAGALVGLAPLLCRTAWHRRWLPLRRLEALASGERSDDAICSPYLNILARRGREADVAGRLAQGLARGEFGRWDELIVPQMDGTAAMTRLLVESCRIAGLGATATVMTEAPYAALPARWDAYLATLSKAHRKWLRGSLRAFDAWAGDGVVVERADSPGALQRGKEVLLELHRRRWRDTAEGGVFRSPLFLAFHDTVLPRLFEAEALELLWLCAHGRPVAAMYSIVWNNKVYYYQSGRDPDLPGNVRPGVALVARAMQRAIDAGRREFDFLGGAAAYKREFATARRPLVELRIARGGMRERLRAALEAGVERTRPLRQAVRRWRGRTEPGGLIARSGDSH